MLTPTLLHLDRHCAVADKPGGFLAVPGRGPDKQDCLTARLRRLCPWCIEQPAPHRLDMDTSGLMVLGLTREAHSRLAEQFAGRTVQKGYLALVEGEPTQDSGRIELAFRLDPNNRPHQIYDPVRGKTGVTLWRKAGRLGEHGPGLTLVCLHPLTGRTHQLRLHAAHALGLQCPIAGDRLYGHGGHDGSGACLRLHAALLAFTHPASGKRLRFLSAPPFLPPDEARAALAELAAFLENQARNSSTVKP